MDNFPTIQQLQDMYKASKVNLQMLGLDGQRSFGKQLHHWLSESLFNKFLVRYLPEFQGTSYNKIFSSLNQIKQTKYHEYRLCCWSLYFIFIAESTRVSQNEVQGTDQQASNKKFIERIDMLFDVNIKKHSPQEMQLSGGILLGMIKEKNCFFDDRINHIQLKMNVENFNKLKTSIIKHIQILIKYYIQTNK